MIGLLKEHLRQSLKEGFDPNKRKRVGGYVIGRSIGQGSFAKVHIGVHFLTKERVAIKVIQKKLVERRDYVRKHMRREAFVLQRLGHPNIVRLYEIMETEHAFYIVMELVEGGDMMKYLNDRNGVKEDEARRFMRQIVSAVDHMHRSGIIHRDLKVENLLMNKDKDIKIIDFGLSNFYDGEHPLHTQCGSPAYAAPEIFSMDEYGPGVDVWSLGVNLYAMVTGGLPFTVDPPNNITKLYAAIMRGCKIPPTVSAGCSDLIRRMLEVDEKKRISVTDIMKHPWINAEYIPLEAWPLKEGTPPDKMDNKVMRYMCDVLSYSESDLTTALATSRPTASYATYHLLLQRLEKGLDFPDTGKIQVTLRNDDTQTSFKTAKSRGTPRTGNRQKEEAVDITLLKHALKTSVAADQSSVPSNLPKLNEMDANKARTHSNCSEKYTKTRQGLNSLFSECRDQLDQTKAQKDCTEMILQRSPDRVEEASTKHRVSDNVDYKCTELPAQKKRGCRLNQRGTAQTSEPEESPLFLTAPELRRLTDRFLTGQTITDRFAPGVQHMLKLELSVKADTVAQHGMQSKPSTANTTLKARKHYQMDNQWKRNKNNDEKNKLNNLNKSDIHCIQKSLLPASQMDRRFDKVKNNEDGHQFTQKRFTVSQTPSIGKRAATLPNMTFNKEHHKGDKSSNQMSRQQLSRAGVYQQTE